MSESKTETNGTVRDLLDYLNHLGLCSCQFKFFNYLIF